MNYEITHEGACLKVRISGKIDNDFLVHVNRAAQDKGYVYSSQHHVWDMLDVDGSMLTKEAVLFLAADDKGVSYSNPEISLALVYTDPNIRMITEEYLKLCEQVDNPWLVRSFKSLSEACVWICPNCPARTCPWAD